LVVAAAARAARRGGQPVTEPLARGELLSAIVRVLPN